ncbi:Uma2 family endonuclease [Desulfobulbus sp. US1]|nr:Uma2 family endonuclease [Desulfobulbus sp. US4]MCW5208259.1 Uma2 family endonuclease [Desulfobulbus sp. US2]MCW5208857.1 Uma2 family endonuclease [Desulfobulbus sp. US1]
MSPSRLHCAVVRNLLLIFARYGYDTFPELTVSIGENKTVDLDLAVDRSNYQCNADDISTKVEVIPEVCIEVLSPKQAISDLIEKAYKLIENDAKSYWLVNPFQNTVTVYSQKNGDVSRKDYTGDTEIPNPFGEDKHIILNDIFK